MGQEILKGQSFFKYKYQYASFIKIKNVMGLLIHLRLCNCISWMTIGSHYNLWVIYTLRYYDIKG